MELADSKGGVKQIQADVCKYFDATKRVLQLEPCPITFEDPDSTFVVIRTGLSGFKAYDPKCMFQIMQSSKPFHPESQRRFLPAEIERVKIYLAYKEAFETIELPRKIIISSFNDFIASPSLYGEIPIALARLLTFDHLDEYFSGIGIDRLQTDSAIRLQFTQIAGQVLSGLPKGSWILRPSTIIGNENLKLYVRTVSYVYETGPSGSNFNNSRILHIMGVGYARLKAQVDTSGNFLQDADLGNDFDVFNSDLIDGYFPSLIHILLDFHRRDLISLSLKRTVEKSGYRLI